MHVGCLQERGVTTKLAWFLSQNVVHYVSAALEEENRSRMKPFFMSGTSHHQPLQVSAKPEKAGQSCCKLLEAVYFNSPCMLNCYRCLSQVLTWPVSSRHGNPWRIKVLLHAARLHVISIISKRWERERECHNLLNLLTDLLESSWCIAWQVKTNSGPHNYTTFHFDVKKLRIIWDWIWPSISVQLSLQWTLPPEPLVAQCELGQKPPFHQSSLRPWDYGIAGLPGATNREEKQGFKVQQISKYI